MTGTVLWIALLVAAVAIEVLGRLRPASVSTLKRAAAMLARQVWGRVILIAFWVFVGFHLFARYTIPHS